MRGYDVVPFDLVRPDADALEDICDTSLLASRMEDCDGVVHLAAISRVAWGEARPDLCQRTNVDGVRAVVETAMACTSRPWLLFTSSREVYGNPVRPLVVETDPIQPINVYGRSKAEGERLVNGARDAGLRTAIIRLSNAYGGRRDHPDRAVPSLVARAIVGERLFITGGDNYFDFVHVDDCVVGLLAALDQLAAGERALPPVHLTTGIATSLRTLARMANETGGGASEVEEAPPRDFDVAGFCGDPARARALLGWQAQTDLLMGLEQVADDLRRNGPLDIIDMPDPEHLGVRLSRSAG